MGFFKNLFNPDPEQARQTDLANAAAAGQGELVRQLLRAGAKVNGTSGFGLTALHTACLKGHVEVVRLLISEGADVNVEFKGKSPLSIATNAGHTEIVKVLVDAGCRR